ncbi:MAG: TIGR04141 family sporadically distributed protein [Pseudobdellovibrionaceae bacterium]
MKTAKTKGQPDLRHKTLSSKASIYLAKEKTDASSPEYLIKDKYRGGELKRVNGELPVPAWTFVIRKQKEMPPWLQPIMDLTGDDEIFEFGEAVSALLFLKVDNRYFCLPYGQGHHLVNKPFFEADFGLDVSNLIVNEEQVTGIDWTTLEPEAPRAKKQTMKGHEINFYRLSALSDIVTSISGRPRDEMFGKKVTGSNSLTLFNKMNIGTLIDVCREILKIKTAATVDDVRVWRNGVNPIHDPAMIEKLNSAFVASVVRDRGESVYFAPPETLAIEEVEGFAVSHKNKMTEITPSLDFQDYLDLLPSLKELSWDQMNSDSVLLKADHYEQPLEKWTVWNCVHAELRYGKTVFIIDSGKWFKVTESIAERVNLVVDSISVRPSDFPLSRDKEKEFDFNRRLGSLNRGYISFDRELIKTGDISSGVEVCDIYTADTELVHVKRGTLSKNFIYLLTQVTTSAKALAGDEVFRAEAMKMISEAAKGRRDFAHTKIPEDVSDAIVLGIITNKSGPWSKILPFMAKLKLVETLTELKAMRFSVSLLKIEMERAAASRASKAS